MTLWKWLALAMFLPACLRAQDPFQVHGYIQGRFTNQEGTPDRLEIRRARLILSGDPLSNLSYTFQVDFVKQPYLMDAALTWKFSRALRLTGGQFKIPFSAESLISDNLNMPIARARAVNGLSPGRDTGVQGRDVGVQLAGTLYRGSSPLIDYAAGVFRGQTLVFAPNAHSPAAAGRAILHPLPGVTDRRGGYALGGWRLTPHWEPLARADWLTTNIHKANTTSIAYLAGLNYFWGKHVKVGANAGAQHDQGPKGFSSLFLAQTMFGF